MGKPLIRLGEFVLGVRIGAGATGEVFAARQPERDIEAAIKVVQGPNHLGGREVEMVQHEAAAMARLRHPGVVAIYDYGRVSEEAARASEGVLDQGAAYLVMERAESGTLRARGRVESLQELLSVLRQILTALAHAHARGLVHRDLKPSNVLVASEDPLRLKLADFGIARMLDRAGAEAGPVVAGGTPLYMAPEQVAERTSDEGPFTDVYALGCLAYLLLTGRPPHEGTAAQVCRAHLLDEPVSPEASFAIPDGLRAWLRRCLAKTPSARYFDAAEARRALDACLSPLALDERGVYSPVASERLLGESRPLPTWRELEAAERPVEDAPAGLSLISMRDLPCEGREQEKDALWRALSGVQRRRTPDLVLLRGAPGVGKSRLLSWLVELSAEHALAYAPWIRHEAEPGAAVGLLPALARFLGLEGRAEDRAMTAQRLGVLCANRPEDETLDFGVLFPAGTPAASPAPVSPIRPEERYATWGRLLARLGRTRPVILALDDAQYGLESLRLARHLLFNFAARDLPLLIVATVDTSALPEREAEAGLLEQLFDRATIVDVAPLPPSPMRTLLRRRLGTSAELANHLMERAGGSPMVARGLLATLVDAGRLCESSRGLELVGTAEVPWPQAARDTWQARLDWFWRTVPEDEREVVVQSVEVAALLGTALEDADWRATLERLGLPPPGAVAVSLLTRGILRAQRGGWIFAHGILSSLLARQAADAGRAKRQHAAIADVLALRLDGDLAFDRLAHHRAQAGQPWRAVDALGSAAEAHFRACRFEQGQAALLERDELLRHLDGPDVRRLRAMGAVHSAEAHCVLGHLAAAKTRVEQVPKDLGEGDDLSLRCDALRVRAMLAQMSGESVAAEELFEAARSLALVLGDRQRLARCHHGVAECAKLLGQLEQAERDYVHAIADFEAVGDLIWQARSTLALGDCARRRGDVATAEAQIRAAIDMASAAGSRHAVAVAQNGLGDTARRAGRSKEAAQWYREAVTNLVELGSDDASLARVNLGYVELERGRHREALAVFEPAIEALHASARPGYALFAEVGALACAASLGQRERARLLLDAVEPRLTPPCTVDDDLAAPLALAYRAADAAGESALAARLAPLANHQLDTLGLPRVG